jgi:hypothetical protein
VVYYHTDTGWFNLTDSMPEQTAHVKRLAVIMFVDIYNSKQMQYVI